MPEQNKLTIWTIGHSTRTLEEFLELLRADNIEAVADVRGHPGSRKYPHFNAAELEVELAYVSIDYKSFKNDLGGRRRPKAASANTVWRNESFRGYADYMETAGFRSGMERLLELAARKRTVVMCAEAVWWRCHRSMIADHLKSLSITVAHIMGSEAITLHPYTSAAHIEDGKLVYGAGV